MKKPILIALTSLVFFCSNSVLAYHFKTQQWTTKNGVRVIFYPAPEVPMVDISLAFAAGSAYDGNQFGLSALTTQMLSQGSSGKDADTIAQSLAETGAQFDASTSHDMVTLNLRTLTDKAPLTQATQTFAEIVTKPDFPLQALAREKKQLFMAVEQSAESPEDVANLSFFQNLYHQHPYAHPVNGTKKTLRALNKKDVRNFYDQYFTANNAILVLVGALDSTEAHQLADHLTQQLKPGKAAIPIVKAFQLTQGAEIAIPFPSSQTTVRLGQVGINYKDPNYFPLIVGNYILGGGSLVSRLAVEVREKEGLTYSVASQFLPMPGDGPFLISLSTKANQAQKALSIAKETLDVFIHQGPKSEELAAAKSYLTGSFPLSLGSNRSIAHLLLGMAFYDLPADYLDTYADKINAVTSAQITKAFREQVQTEKLLLVQVGQL